MNLSPIGNGMFDKVVQMLNERAAAAGVDDGIDRTLLRQLELEAQEEEEAVEEEEAAEGLGPFPNWTAEMYAARHTASALGWAEALRDDLQEALYNLKLYDKYRTLAENPSLSAEERASHERLRDYYAYRLESRDIDLDRIDRSADRRRELLEAPYTQGGAEAALGGHLDLLTVEGLGLSGYNDMTVEEKIEALTRAIGTVKRQHNQAWTSAAQHFADYDGSISWEVDPMLNSVKNLGPIERHAESVEEYEQIVRYFTGGYERLYPWDPLVEEVFMTMTEQTNPLIIENLFDADGNLNIDEEAQMKMTYGNQGNGHRQYSSYREWYDSVINGLDAWA